MIALAFLCWFGLAVIVICCIVAALQDHRASKCPDHIPDWMLR